MQSHGLVIGWRTTTARAVAILLISSASACDREPIAPTSEAVDSASLLMEAVSVTNLTGTVGEIVDPAPSVIVKTSRGKPVSGMLVNFVTGGSEANGSVTRSAALTNAQGIATPGEWRLGPHSDRQVLVASLQASGPARSITFRVQAAFGAPSRFRIAPNADQIGLPNWEISGPAVWLNDRFGNFVAKRGVPVTFAVTAGGGTMAKTVVETDSSGYASAGIWTLGPKPGFNSVIASAANLDGATFTAQALDERGLTWYDLDSVENKSTSIKSGSIGLGQNGFFVGETFYGEAGRRWFGGKYKVSSPEFIFEQVTGTDGWPYWGENRFVGDRLSISWCPPWYDCGFAYPPADELRHYAKRKSQ